jgi:hypothetical protein
MLNAHLCSIFNTMCSALHPLNKIKRFLGVSLLCL